MKTDVKTMDSYIERLSEIASSIKSIYVNLSNSTNSPEKINEYEEYLKIATEIEDRIYQEIDSELLTSEHFLHRIKYLISGKDLETKDEIYNRIINYITQSTYLNPFPSIRKNKIDRESENILAIRNQASLDYLKGVFININKEIDNTADEQRRKKLITAKNNLLFANKMLGKIIQNEKTLNIDGRERCIAFNQDEKSIKVIYINFSYEIINYCIYYILSNDENIIEQIELKSALAILNPSEIFEVSRKYYKATTEDPVYERLSKNNNNEIIINIIKEFLENKKNPSKKRT